MERDLFVRHFANAARAAREFASRYVAEALPENLSFRVRLNVSFDENPLHPDERVYPEDTTLEAELNDVPADRVVSALWRDRAVPEWIDLSVVGLSDSTTLIEVACCGRFTVDDTLLYHARSGTPPFHVLSPQLPPDYVEGQRFSLRGKTPRGSG